MEALQWLRATVDDVLERSADVLPFFVLALVAYGLGRELALWIDRRRRHVEVGCPFCEAANGKPVTQVIRVWRDAVALVPLAPVVSGHVIVMPRWHVRDAGEDARTTARVMRRAAELVGEDFGAVNIITSRGGAATQTVLHLHVHIVPRKHDDGLMLPWSDQVRTQMPPLV